MLCRVEIEFKDLSYVESIPYVPSNPLSMIPPYILKGLSQGKPERLKELQEKAGSKQSKQKEYILNVLTGRLGERIIKDYLISKGFKVRVRFNPGDYSGEYLGSDYIIEVKTFRGDRVQLRRKQVREIKRLADRQKKKVLFYVLGLYFLGYHKEEAREILKDQVEVYRYRVQIIRHINMLIKGRMIGNKVIEIPRNALYTHFTFMKYPYYFHH